MDIDLCCEGEHEERSVKMMFFGFLCSCFGAIYNFWTHDFVCGMWALTSAVLFLGFSLRDEV
ncbi:MAG: hypothetical protein BWY42_01267 [Candidatus Omnitrophica bacterium ADurb.Bin277]|nr:MAG: hypothetical protein BWY42_01267 [Candidatus Omnitrophica bacterium ADurb.Bin277]